MLEVKDIVVRYGIDHTVLDGVTMSLEEGKIHGLVGANGSGKTTLLGCVKGIVPFQEGDITYNGRSIDKSVVSLLETDNYFYKRITGEEYLALFKAFNENFDFDKWNALFDLPLHKMIDDYSTGMKKKLAFISILSFETPVIILDEPFNGIDMETVQLFKVILRKLKDWGHTIIITSHILESLVGICDTISYLNARCIERVFYPEEFKSMEASLFEALDERHRNQVNAIWK